MAYHGVHPDQVDSITHSPDSFAAQMSSLAGRGFRGVTLSELCQMAQESGRWPEKTVALTFDDGYADCWEFAAPILARYGFTATTFIITDTLERGTARPLHCHPSKKFLTEAQICELARQRWEIASHSCNHARLASIPETEQRQQIFRSRQTLEDRLNVKVTSFCYPGGSLNRAITRAVSEAGYTQAVVTPWAPNSVVPGDWLTLERVGFYPADSSIKFNLKLTPLFHWLRRTRLIARFGNTPPPGLP